MITVDVNQNLSELLPIITESAHSRFPVTDGDKDAVVGILLAKDLLRQPEAENNNTRPWATLLRPAVFIPESKRLNVLLQEFRDSRNHMAIVVNEYGSVVGLITIEDVLEQIVGNIEDEHDIEEEDIVEISKGTFSADAKVEIEEFTEFFNLKVDPMTIDAETLGGFVINQLGVLPKVGDKIEIDNLIIKVTHADDRKIDKVLITKN
jgi:magnesium and cobalt transporter